MKKSKITAVFNSDIESVWNVVTNNNDYSWRSDLSKIEVKDNEFIEYTKDNFPTKFVITVKKECERYEFDMKNKNMKGHWTGLFRKVDNGTEVEFIEEVEVNNFIMNLFVGKYLNKQQNLYIEDLRKRLNEK